ncbi:hypothetical protein [Armatimonas rosea]|uniref:Tetratricopeptide repeat protein n=1 Tax=Armatimonas rosea TaxID=685828 RepID=A0A7W9W9W5_ARMRO|nr:hypothetical protein [Armatimonas rosea]MBB6053731.1 hypothetical protein [Armatimonas rosea]
MMSPPSELELHLEALHALAVMRWDAGEHEAARRFWRQGCAIYESLSWDQQLWSSFPYTEALVMLGRDTEAERLVRESRHERWERAKLHPAWRRLGRPFEDPERVAGDSQPLDSVALRAQILRDAEQGRWAAALQGITELSPHLLYNHHPAAVRAKVAVLLWQAGEREWARSLLDQAEDETRAIPLHYRSDTLACVAEGWSVVDRARASTLYTEATEALLAVPFGYRWKPLEKLIGSLTSQGFFAEATTLLESTASWERQKNGLRVFLRASLRHGAGVLRAGANPLAQERLWETVRQAAPLLNAPNDMDTYEDKELMQQALEQLARTHTPLSPYDFLLLKDLRWGEALAAYCCLSFEQGNLPDEHLKLLCYLRGVAYEIAWYLSLNSPSPETAVRFLNLLPPTEAAAYALARLGCFDEAQGIARQLSDQVQGEQALSVIQRQAEAAATR